MSKSPSKSPSKSDMNAYKLSKECDSLDDSFCDDISTPILIDLLESVKILAVKLERSLNSRTHDIISLYKNKK